MNNNGKRTSSQEVVDYLLAQIQSGALRKGSKLPTEHELTELLGVSRIPIREAISALRTVGILESRQGGSTSVTTKCDPAILGHMLYDYAILENVDLHQVVDVRMLLEPEAAKQAALQGSLRQKEEIFKLSQEYKSVTDSYKSSEENDLLIAEIDQNIHEAIARASHNDFLWMLLVVSGTSFGELNRKNSQAVDGWGEQKRLLFSRQHIDIAQAILDGNATQAKKSMEKHIQSIKYALTARP